MAAQTGVFPVHKNQFKISTTGRPAGTGTTAYTLIKDLTTFGVSIEGTNEEWFPLDQEGWARQANTGKKMVISLSGKRQHGDPGQDYIAGMMMKTGKDCESAFEWTLPAEQNSLATALSILPTLAVATALLLKTLSLNSW